MPIAYPSETNTLPSIRLDDSRPPTPETALFHYSRRQRKGERPTRSGWVHEKELWTDFCLRFDQPTAGAGSWDHRIYQNTRRFLGSLIVDVQGVLPDTCIPLMDANTAPVPFLAFALPRDEIRVIVPLAKPVPLRSARVAVRRKIVKLIPSWFGLTWGVDMSRSWATWGFGPPHTDWTGPRLPRYVVKKDGPLSTWDQLAALTVTRKGGAR